MRNKKNKIELISKVELPLKKRFLTRMKKYLEYILSIENKTNKNIISLCFIDDTEIKQLNKTYRKKNKATDVLSFSQVEEDETFPDDNNNYLGDIFISIDTAIKEAKLENISIEDEVLKLSVHGLLHLCGYDHEKSQEDEVIMFEKQDYYYNYFQEFRVNANNNIRKKTD